MNVNRRHFVQHSAAVVAAGTINAAAGRAEEKPDKRKSMLPIVDTHQHLWDLSKLRLPWLSGAGKLNRSYVTEDYLEAIRGLNVVQAVYMEVAVAVEQQLAEAEYVVELCKRPDVPTCAAVIGGRPAGEGFRAYVTRFRDSPFVKGIRHIPQADELQQGLWRQKSFLDGIRLLGELGMSFDLCMPPAALPEAARLVDQCPGTRFILDHCGNADPKAFRRAGGQAGQARHDPQQWRRDMAALARRKHVVCKISGIIASAPDDWTPDDLAPIVNHCIEVFGPERVMFASDWPVCTRVASLRQWVEALLEILRPRDEALQRNLLADNAMRFYRLKPKPWRR